MSTARGVALVRALEMLRPETERITADPYAARFADPLMLTATRLSIATGVSRLIGIEGMINFALLRERFIDDLMRQELADGAEQIVVLGAGFDTRAYRLGRADVAVFEVDHPDTQADKRRALAGVLELPKNVRFVPVDFDRDDLAERLAAAGYDPNKRTVFVWQGVIVYLTPQGIDATLSVVAANRDPMSLLVFDYGYVDRPNGAAAGWAVRFFTGAMGERIGFGFRRGEVGPFLKARGFAGVETVEMPELEARYLQGQRRPVALDVAIAFARVRGRG